MSTMTPPEAPASQPAPPAAADVTRFVAIRANLLPDEIANARRVGAMIRKVGIGLVAVVALVICGYGVSAWQTSAAKDNLLSAQGRSAKLLNQQQRFTPLVTAQSQAASIKASLTKLMVGDLLWKDLLAALRTNAPAGMTITSVTGTAIVGAAGAPDGAAGGLGILNRSGKQQVGTLTIAGTAPDKNSVAAFIDALTKVPGLAAPYPASVTGQRGKLTFSASVLITSDALGGRYAGSTQGGH